MIVRETGFGGVGSVYGSVYENIHSGCIRSSLVREE